MERPNGEVILDEVKQEVESFEQFYQQQKGVIPYVVHEQEMFRGERREKRLIGLISALLALLLLTNGAWLWYESQFYVTETVTTEIVQDGQGINSIAGGDIYGADN